MLNRLRGKGGQVTVFIIIAIVIIAAVGIYFVYRGNLFSSSIPKDFEPVYNYYLSCVQENANQGALLLGSQGGYIEKPDFSPGSEYMPFSSQLNFLGSGVPYWYYVAGNGVAKEQVPTLEKMQEQLNGYLDERISLCDFSQFEEQGFNVTLGEPIVKTTIENNQIQVDVENDLAVGFGNKSFRKTTHTTSVTSNLGRFYDLATKIYLNQKENMFLENYSIDILRLYAPVTGSEIGCSPRIWYLNNIKNDLVNALGVNIPEIKIKGDYYTLAAAQNKYFIRDIGENVNDANVNFMYSPDWPLKLEAWPSQDGILRADPVGQQQGLGMLGFCYTPYQFVYDFAYPVMVQIYSGNEVFQFPMVVSIQKNSPRVAPNVEGLPNVVPELCEHRNTKMSVSVYDTKLNPVEADISFKCFDTTCHIGSTNLTGGDSILEDNFPQCENGFIMASANGYKTQKYVVSTVTPGSASIILNKEYNLSLDVLKDGNEMDSDFAVITFENNNETTTVSYPEQKQVELIDGMYTVKAYVYSNSTISVKGSSTEKCVDMPKSGILGAFGMTEQKCFTMNIPDQIVSSAVSGGGSQNYYFTEDELENSKKVTINVPGFGIPTTVEKLQDNYNNVDISNLDIQLG